MILQQFQHCAAKSDSHCISDADVVLFFGGLNKSDGQDCEGNDRNNYSLPYAQDRLIEALVAANPRTAGLI